MMKLTFFVAIFSFISLLGNAQTREELEKQKQQLKREIAETQKLLDGTNAEKNKTLSGVIILTHKANLQDRVVGTITKDLNILDNNIYSIQRDVNRYDRLLDTLKQEYAKSMVYAYKNRGNYEFLNFIFSANTFNDAIKRMSYLKSYRAYREMQGQNILRTQELRRKRLEDLGATKETKKSSLEVQKEEMEKLATQKAEQEKIVEDLKKKGKSLASRIAEKQKQVAKVNAAVKAAIAKAIKEEKERARLEAIRIKKEKADANAKAKKENATAKTDVVTTKTKTTRKPKVAPAEPETKDFNTENIALNSNFERNKGSLPWPVDNGAVINHFGPIVLHDNLKIDNKAITIKADIGASVKAVFDGTVILVSEVDDGKYMVLIKHGGYYTTYENLSNVIVKKDELVKARQELGKVASNYDGIGSIDFYTKKRYDDLDPEKWLRKK